MFLISSVHATQHMYYFELRCLLSSKSAELRNKSRLDRHLLSNLRSCGYFSATSCICCVEPYKENKIRHKNILHNDLYFTVSFYRDKNCTDLKGEVYRLSVTEKRLRKSQHAMRQT